MPTLARRILRLRLTVADVDRPVERIVEVDADACLASLHEVIERVFAWASDARHVFTDTRLPIVTPDWADGLTRHPAPNRHRVWSRVTRGHLTTHP